MSEWNLTGATSTLSVDEPLSVSDAMELAASALSAIPQLTVMGEVSGFRGPNARSGHCYFQIKDSSAAVDCIIWRGVYGKRTFDLRDGMQIQFKGSFNLYKPTGRMSFVARSFTLAGEGLLRQQVAALAEKLRREGLMDEACKRYIPPFCTRVAVVTSLSGAVIDDVKRTLRRRNPLVEIICVGAKVQGEGAPAELIGALARAASLQPAPECILLVRGGGSFEDLMTFNDEALARAVAACPVPVVTGIGHEPDTSICDMVSDRRSSTPTAAAESVAPSMDELTKLTEERAERLSRAFFVTVNQARSNLDAYGNSMVQAMRRALERRHVEVEAMSSRPVLLRPEGVLEQRIHELEQTAERLLAAGPRALERHAGPAERLGASLLTAGSKIVSASAATLASAAAKLDALSPLKVLARGYSIAYGTEGVAFSVDDFAPGDALRVRLLDGDVYGSVNSVEKRKG